MLPAYGQESTHGWMLGSVGMSSRIDRISPERRSARRRKNQVAPTAYCMRSTRLDQRKLARRATVRNGMSGTGATVRVQHPKHACMSVA